MNELTDSCMKVSKRINEFMKLIVLSPKNSSTKDKVF